MCASADKLVKLLISELVDWEKTGGVFNAMYLKAWIRVPGLLARTPIRNRTRMTRMRQIFTDQIRENPLNRCFWCSIEIHMTKEKG